jgi:hypothetical protein
MQKTQEKRTTQLAFDQLFQGIDLDIVFLGFELLKEFSLLKQEKHQKVITTAST